MKKSTYHIICAWALLAAFVVGQYMVYAHQHNQVKNIHFAYKHDCKNSSHLVVKEKCEICDSMHHTAMEMGQQPQYQPALATTDRVYVSPVYEFTTISLILAAGRAPPIS